ncbi:MAG: metallophosphoesterase [Deltaproteobacteria bacterium]|nr:metallophosphoesterase [Deltaproteobacteria bacterium]
METFVIGDVHGCLEELDELLALIGTGPRLVFAGDLMDRGPDPVGVVRRVRELGALCVMGNHDEKHVRWARHEAKRRADPGYRNPMQPLPEQRLAEHAALGDDGVAFLAGLPSRLDLGDSWWVVHGGAIPGRPVAEQKAAALLRCRYLDANDKMLSKADPTPDARHWAVRWAGPESIVYGHHVHGHEPRFDRANGATCAGIDTGCCFGGRLTAFAPRSGEVIQVPARRAYAELREAIEE